MKPANSFDDLYRQIRLRKVSFFIAFFTVILLTYTILYVIDFIPEPVGHDDRTEESTAVVNTDTPTEVQAIAEQIVENTRQGTPPSSEIVDRLPTKIFIDKLDKVITILNPTETTIPAMDAALLKGVVRHPDSADFKKTGNMLLLGHSSYLPNVLNKNFQAFNGIQKLTWGDKIRVQSGDTEYIYRVDKMRKESATDVVVPYDWGRSKLTLVTCNVYGAKEDRFIVEATLVSTRII